MIEESWLPQWNRIMVSSVQEFGGPFFPFTDKGSEGGALWSSTAKEMHMIGHHDIRPHSPAMKQLAFIPNLMKNLVSLLASQQGLPTVNANRNEVDRVMNP